MNLSFLKKLGHVIVAGEQIVAGVAPFFLPFLGSKAGNVVAVATGDLEAIAGLIASAEVMFPADGTGKQKLQSIAPLVIQALKASSIVSGMKIADPVKFAAAAQGIASNIADLLTSLSSEGIETAGHPVPPVPAAPAS